VSLLYLLLIFVVWLGGPSLMVEPRVSAGVSAGVFAGGYAALVLGVAAWSRALARGMERGRLHRSVERFNRMLSLARLAVPVWLAVAIFTPLGYGRLVLEGMSSWAVVRFSHGGQTMAVGLALPAFIAGTLPSLLTWVGLWWAQYPADRAMREQSVMDQLALSLPVRSAPALGQYLAINVRLQLLFALVPLLLMLLLRDGAVMAMRVSGLYPWRASAVEDWLLLPAAAPVLLLGPEILRRIWHTEPLPPSPLRRRLERMCRRYRLGYRDILLWHTQFMTGNAAVMGLVGPLRYILLSDLLLETLTDEQIEAVFAHEMGHVVHRHMAWYALFFILVGLAAAALDAAAALVVKPATLSGLAGLADMDAAVLARTVREGVVVLSMGAMAVGGFGFIGRLFERQADVFAARTMGGSGNAFDEGDAPEAADGAAGRDSARVTWGHVGQEGAMAFISALNRVAAINNIPMRGRSWPHGSIASRMEYLMHLAADPEATEEFDRGMRRLYWGLLAATVVCAAAAIALPSG